MLSPFQQPQSRCENCGELWWDRHTCVDPIPEIEFHSGKRPHEMTTDELLAAIEYVRSDPGDREVRWRKKLADEFDKRRAALVGGA